MEFEEFCLASKREADQEESGRIGFYRVISSQGFVHLILELLELLILTRNACGPVSIRAAIAG